MKCHNIRLYLAADFEDRERMQKIAEKLKDWNINVVSTWHQDTSDTTREIDTLQQELYALSNIRDLVKANAVFVFGRNGKSRGGKHFEMGFGVAHGCAVMIVDDPKPTSHYSIFMNNIPNANIKIIERWEDGINYLLNLVVRKQAV